MEIRNKERIVAEIARLMGDDAAKALEYKRSNQRMDAMMECLRKAMEKSSMGLYNGKPYYYNGRIYQEISWEDFGDIVYRCLRARNLPDGDYTRLEAAKKLCRTAVCSKELKLNKNIIVFRNCVYDLEHKQMRRFSKELVQVCEVDYDYDPNQLYSNAWEIFLDEVLPNRTMQKVLQEYLGAIFIDRRQAKIEHILILHGPGQNGKGVVFETIFGILGKDNISNVPLGELISGNDKKKNIATINGKKLNYCTEIGAFAIDKGADTLKQLISGEPVQGREIYGNNFTAYDIPLFIANCNTLPRLRDSSHGMARRLIILPFERIITEEKMNTQLSQQLKSEYSAIFNWIMEGRDRFIKQGYKFTKEPELQRIVEDYRIEDDSVLKFMKEHKLARTFEDLAQTEPIKWIESSRLYKKYSVWCRQTGIEPENVTVFGRTLASAGYRKNRTASGNMIGYYGSETFNMHIRRREIRNENERRDSCKTELGKKAVPITDPDTGVKIIYGYEGLSRNIGLSIYEIQAAVRKGVIKDYRKENENDSKFNLTEIMENITEISQSLRTYQKLLLRRGEEEWEI
ncbi:MAG: phage/plasmid primase, P4 family [Bacteroidales bacterium]|nr:phage/plasmid primase, P4 family [Bacteroidales bacterium]MCC8119883.1 phage/plasmid primase, P4 family [Bacteroidales bacterium]